MKSIEYYDTIKYVCVAALLKLFSIEPRLYRFLGNKIGFKKRLHINILDYYGERANQFLRLCQKHNVIKDGDDVIEIGTGWIHFESIILKLLYDINATLYDVWDNRQFEVLKQYSSKLEELIIKNIDLTEDQKHYLRSTIEKIFDANSYDEMYQSLNFKYVINSFGTLDQFQDDTFQLVYSCNVLEHINSKATFRLLQDFYRILKPGGFSIHKIDFSDHLISFAGIRNLPKKNYLKYSDKSWKMFFENNVQYINRIQYQDWKRLFKKAGFEFVEEKIQVCNIDQIKVANKFKYLDRKDLECESVMLIHKKNE